MALLSFGVALLSFGVALLSLVMAAQGRGQLEQVPAGVRCQMTPPAWVSYARVESAVCQIEGAGPGFSPEADSGIFCVV